MTSKRRPDWKAPPDDAPPPREDGFRNPSSCWRSDGTSKIGFAKKADAKRYNRRVGAKGGRRQRAYHCPTCRHWHLGG